jgi:HAE1 family hydrophobic/amphiphilic exporter-1
MTAIATILALIPLAAGFNEGSIIAAELGTVVIGGLLSSTVLTLLVIPALYSLVARIRGRLPGGQPSST